MHLINNVLGDKEEIVALHLSSWLTKEERLTVEEEFVKLKLSYTIICDKGKDTFIVSRYPPMLLYYNFMNVAAWVHI